MKVTKPPVLSVLIGAVPSRLQENGIPLFEKISRQAEGHPVEVLFLLDNLWCTAGVKRDRLLQNALGTYVSYVDDDDYVSSLVDGIAAGRDCDVVTFAEQNDIDGQVAVITCRLGAAMSPWTGEPITRPPWHWCAWRRGLAQAFRFPDMCFGDDIAWLNQILPYARTEYHIPKVLKTYRHRSQETYCPPEG